MARSPALYATLDDPPLATQSSYVNPVAAAGTLIATTAATAAAAAAVAAAAARPCPAILLQGLLLDVAAPLLLLPVGPGLIGSFFHYRMCCCRWCWHTALLAHRRRCGQNVGVAVVGNECVVNSTTIKRRTHAVRLLPTH